MNRKRIVAALAAAVLGLSGSLVGGAPASAGTFGCYTSVFIKHNATGRYFSVDEGGSYTLRADGTVKGWWEQFQMCWDSDWASQYFALRSGAASAAAGADRYLARSTGGVISAGIGGLTGNHLFSWVSEGPYFGLKHGETKVYVTASAGDTRVRTGTTAIGPNQQLTKE